MRQREGASLLSMMNYLPQWVRPRGPLSAEQVAEGFCDLLLDGASRVES